MRSRRLPIAPPLSIALVLATSVGGRAARADEAADADAPPRFEEVVVTDIAQPKRPGEVWVGLEPRLEHGRSGMALDLPLHIETGIAPDLGVELPVAPHAGEEPGVVGPFWRRF